jgi:class 3 adenylate cyclase
VEAEQRWTRAFRDPEIEDAWQQHAETSAIAHHRRIWLLLTVFWVGAVAIDRAISGSEANYRVLTIYRFAVGLPIFAAVSACGWLPRRLWRRWKTVIAFVGSTALLWLPMCVAMSFPDKSVFDATSSRLGWVVAIIFVCTMLATRWVIAFFTAVPALIGAWILLVALTPGPDNAAVAFWYASATTAGLLAIWQIEQSNRRAFVANRSLAAERARSESLLKNMLPTVIAEQLKQTPGRIAEQFDDVTVLFADIVGFTGLSSRLSAKEIVDVLDEIFTAFDAIARRHGLEKIKTIGDAYMVVGGAPTRSADHSAAVARMALEMRALVAEQSFGAAGRVRLRIGLHRGPVVAGVIGTAKYSYDLWGDTVNTASRMESHGEEGAIHVSEALKQRLDGAFSFRSRGVILLKGLGERPTWFLEGAINSHL